MPRRKQFPGSLTRRYLDITTVSPQKPCGYHKKAPCGSSGETADFPDEAHCIRDRGLRELNETRADKIFRKGFFTPPAASRRVPTLTGKGKWMNLQELGGELEGEAVFTC